MNAAYWDVADPPPVRCQNCVVSIGNFDGVHKGHAALLRRLACLKERLGRLSLVATFDPPPVTLLRPDHPGEQLTTLPQRIKLLQGYGVDEVLIFRTNEALLSISAESFWSDLLVSRLQARGFVEGSNFRFGRDRSGTVHQLQLWCKDKAIPCEIVHDVYRQGIRISSTQIRSLLLQGQVDRARIALGRFYSLDGRVVRGDRRGSRIGFPTANLETIPTLIPGMGVYAALAHVDQGHYAAAVNIGPNPTFGVQVNKVEAHLLDYTGDLYGKSVTLDFVARLRETKTFPSVDALKSQLRADVEQTGRILHSILEKCRGTNTAG